MKNLIVLISFSTCCLLMNCKSECVNAPDETVLLNKSQVNSLPYKGSDSIVFKIAEVLTPVKSTPYESYFNSYQSNTKCAAVQKLEGNKILFTDSLQTNLLYHSISANQFDTAVANIAVSYKAANFSFPYKYLKAPYVRVSLTIDGKSYANVYSTKTGSDSIYYSLDKGIIRIALANGTILQLP